MNLAALLALLTLTFTDATGDAIGDGTLEPPTAPIYANAALFDLQGVELEVAETGEAVLRVTLGSIGGSGGATGAAGADANAAAEGDVPEGGAADAAADDAAPGEPATAEDAGPAGAGEGAAQPEPVFESFDPSGLLAIVDVYLDSGPGGATSTMEGPNMLMPLGVGWNHAVRLSAAGAQAITFVGTGPLEPDASSARLPSAEPVMVPADPEEEPVEAAVATDTGSAGPAEADGSELSGAGAEGEVPTATIAPALQELVPVPLELFRRGNVLEMRLPWQLDPEATIDVYAMVGVHDPFSPHGWRQLADSPSPWAFSGSEQVTPVIDLLAESAEVQSDALRRGVLPMPPREPGMSLPLSPWLWLMIGGLALALLGLVMRGRVPGVATEATDVEPEAGPDDDEGSEAADAPDRDGAAVPATDEDEPQPAEEPVEVPLEEDPRELPLPPEDTNDETDDVPIDPPEVKDLTDDVTDDGADEVTDDGTDEVTDDGADVGTADGPGDGNDDGRDEVPSPAEEPTEVPMERTPSQGVSPAEGASTAGNAAGGSSLLVTRPTTKRTLGAANAFDSVVGRSFLEDGDGGFGAGAESDESFWHPGSRGRRNGGSAEAEEN